jgi:hypothetical protein
VNSMEYFPACQMMKNYFKLFADQIIRNSSAVQTEIILFL